MFENTMCQEPQDMELEGDYNDIFDIGGIRPKLTKFKHSWKLLYSTADIFTMHFAADRPVSFPSHYEYMHLIK